MIIKIKKTRLLFALPLVVLSTALLSKQVVALDLTKAEIGGISISTGDFVAASTLAVSNSSDSSSSSTPSLSDDSDSQASPQKTIDQMIAEMKVGNTVAVYNLMSAEFRDTFTLDNFKTAWVESGEQIISVENLLTPQTLLNGWYEQQIVAKTQSGKEDKFNLVLHLEDGVWVIYATELLT